MSEVTLVSIVPFELKEYKPTLFPGRFNVPASVNNEPQILHVGTSACFIPRIDMDSMAVKIQPQEIAQAIVFDFQQAQLGIDEDAVPGLFWLDGKYTVTEVKTKFADKLFEAKQKQQNWLLNLVKIADDDWVKGNKRHIYISDIQRTAAKMLGLDREWLIVIKDVLPATVNCKVCQSPVNATAIVCPICKAVLRPEEYKQLQFVGA